MRSGVQSGFHGPVMGEPRMVRPPRQREQERPEEAGAALTSGQCTEIQQVLTRRPSGAGCWEHWRGSPVRRSATSRRGTARGGCGNCHHMNGFCSHGNKCPLSRKVYMVERGLKQSPEADFFFQWNMALIFYETLNTSSVEELNGINNVQSPWAGCLQVWQPFPGTLDGMFDIASQSPGLRS